MMVNKYINTVLIVLAFLTAGACVEAQGRRSPSSKSPSLPGKQADPPDNLAQLRAGLIKATNDYKKSLTELLVFYEASVRKAAERSEQVKKLYAEGLVSKRELEGSEEAETAARVKVDEARKQLTEADHFIVESNHMEELARAVSLPPKTLVTKTAYIRYSGATNWTLSDAGKIANFFAARFSRTLPVSAFGQSTVHDRMGFDHRNAIDVAVHPDSVEGQTLIAHLRERGIPFIAFRRAVPGSATGAHIHIGRPSHKIAVQ